MSGISIKKIETDIDNFEKDIVLKCNFKFPDKFTESINHYRTAVNLLHQDLNCYKVLRNLIIDKDDTYEIEIWNSNHYENICNFRRIDFMLKNIFKKAVSFSLITIFQYKLIKYIHKKVINIWNNDTIFENFILDKKISNDLPNDNELLYFFNIIDLLIYKSEYNKINLDLVETSPVEILNNKDYLKSIQSLKNIFQNIFKNI